ncbi:CBS domain-containing protein [Vibrio sp. 404]|uniref:CBS domain-containing protein n=1 Tax=Vibrio marinisediminis TaxID=2758441 RepID=A0A7W2FQA7_9VIBR|nr:CBS domain-containing protein [Vibrio marinisediminis]MBA5762330.1 CBS domain-containing protein [Vibrio marinisediminis]
MIKVEDMMTRNPHTLLRSHQLVDAKHTMEALDIRHIPIVDGDRHLLGIITQRDVLAAQDSTLHEVQEEQSFTLNTPIYEVMCTNVMSVTPKAGLKETALYMQKHKVGCLPVVDKGRLVGIITNSDFVSIAISLLELQEEVEPEEMED